VLVDTNVLVRTLQPHHPLFATALNAISVLPKRGRTLHIVPQNLMELWVVMTRPLGTNGLGLTVDQARTELSRMKSIFFLLPETPAVYPAWERLVIEHQVSGKTTHDTRLVAAMQVHGLAEILTFNASDFARYSEVAVVDPNEVDDPNESDEGPGS